MGSGVGLIFGKNHPVEVSLHGTPEEPARLGKLFGNIEGKGLLAGGFEGPPFAVGQELALRIRLEGTVIGFWGTVLERMEPGGEIYLISIPEKADTVTRREAERLSVLIPVKVELFNGEPETGERYGRGVLTNISLTGCALISRGALPEKAHCRISFSLPGEEKAQVFEGEICRREQGSERSVLGVRFMGQQASAGGLKGWLQENLGLVAKDS